ncbi:MAG: hypothetical protein CM15mP128_1620 [Methanobacteriota archaeon]|nr:MAG: hypothetical protein CM15mP128_1620 [Euryarchaeota archaeon]
MADISTVAALAALTREESRGGHTRDDFPVPDEDHWGQHLNIVWMEDGDIKIRQERVEPIRQDLKALDEVKAMIKERAEQQGGGK